MAQVESIGLVPFARAKGLNPDEGTVEKAV
jgi:hypothetical protein